MIADKMVIRDIKVQSDWLDIDR